MQFPGYGLSEPVREQKERLPIRRLDHRANASPPGVFALLSTSLILLP